MPLCTIAIINTLDTLRLIINYDMRIVDCGISIAVKVYLVDYAGAISHDGPHVIAGTVAGRDQRR